jgi:phage gp29-like protein
VNIRKLFGKLIASRTPTRRLATVSGDQEPPALALNMDAGRIMAIIAAAEGGYTRDLFALYRDMLLADSHLQSEFAKRKLAVLGDVLSLRPADKKRPDDESAAQSVRAAIAACPGWRAANAHLLNASLYPVAIVEKVFRPTPTGYSIAALVPVPYQLLDYTRGKMRIYDVDPATGNIMASAQEPDPARYIVHRGHLLSAPDNWGGPMRSVLFWWLLSTMSREWWARFLERYGSPFMVGTFADDEGRSILERAFSLATRLGGLVVSDGTKAEIKQAAASDSGEAYKAFIDLCQREKSKLVVGQTLSSEAQPTGLGSGTANMQEGVRQDIRKFDAAMLSDTLRDQLITQYCRANRLTGCPPSIMWGADSNEEIRGTLSLLGSITTAGLEVSDDAIPVLSERIGFGLQRKSGGALFSALRGPAAGALHTFRAHHAEAARIVLTSRSHVEAMARLRVAFPDIPADVLPGLVADAITLGAEGGPA